jgi:hypothetical protein
MFDQQTSALVAQIENAEGVLSFSLGLARLLRAYPRNPSSILCRLYAPLTRGVASPDTIGTSAAQYASHPLLSISYPIGSNQPPQAEYKPKTNQYRPKKRPHRSFQAKAGLSSVAMAKEDGPGASRSAHPSARGQKIYQAQTSQNPLPRRSLRAKEGLPSVALAKEGQLT